MTGLITIQQAVGNFKNLIEGSVIKGGINAKNHFHQYQKSDEFFGEKF